MKKMCTGKPNSKGERCFYLESSLCVFLKHKRTQQGKQWKQSFLFSKSATQHCVAASESVGMVLSLLACSNHWGNCRYFTLPLTILRGTCTYNKIKRVQYVVGNNSLIFPVEAKSQGKSTFGSSSMQCLYIICWKALQYTFGISLCLLEAIVGTPKARFVVSL